MKYKMLANFKSKLNIATLFALAFVSVLLISGHSVLAQEATNTYASAPKLKFDPAFGALEKGDTATYNIVVDDVAGQNINVAKILVRASAGVTITQIEEANGMLALKPFVAGDYAKIDVSKQQDYFENGDILATISVEAEEDITVPSEPDGTGGTGDSTGDNSSGGSGSGSGGSTSGSGDTTTSATDEGIYFGEGTQIGGSDYNDLPLGFEDGSDPELTGLPVTSGVSQPVSSTVEDGEGSILDKIQNKISEYVGEDVSDKTIAIVALAFILLLILATLIGILRSARSSSGDSSSDDSDGGSTQTPVPPIATDPLGGPSTDTTMPQSTLSPTSAPQPSTPPAQATTPTPQPTSPLPSPEAPGPISETVVKPAPKN